MEDKEIEYERITKDWQIISGDSPKTVKSKATLYWIRIKESENRTHTTSRDNTYKLNDIDILDRELKPSSIEKNRFSITGIYHTHKPGETYDVTFKDSFGKTRVIVRSPWTRALDFLDELDQFHSWIEYDLNEENNQLKSQIERLEEGLQEQVDSNYDETETLNKEISELQEQIKELKKRKRTPRKKAK
jgi:cell division protein FtsB